MLPYAHSEELMHGTEDGQIGLSLSAFEHWIGVGPSERRDEVDPPQEPEHLNEPSKDPDGHGERDDPREAERLTEQYDGGD